MSRFTKKEALSFLEEQQEEEEDEVFAVRKSKASRQLSRSVRLQKRLQQHASASAAAWSASVRDAGLPGTKKAGDGSDNKAVLSSNSGSTTESTTTEAPVLFRRRGNTAHRNRKEAASDSRTAEDGGEEDETASPSALLSIQRSAQAMRTNQQTLCFTETFMSTAAKQNTATSSGEDDDDEGSSMSVLAKDRLLLSSYFPPNAAAYEESVETLAGSSGRGLLPSSRPAASTVAAASQRRPDDFSTSLSEPAVSEPDPSHVSRGEHAAAETPKNRYSRSVGHILSVQEDEEASGTRRQDSTTEEMVRRARLHRERARAISAGNYIPVNSPSVANSGQATTLAAPGSTFSAALRDIGWSREAKRNSQSVGHHGSETGRSIESFLGEDDEENSEDISKWEMEQIMKGSGRRVKSLASTVSVSTSRLGSATSQVLQPAAHFSSSMATASASYEGAQQLGAGTARESSNTVEAIYRTMQSVLQSDEPDISGDPYINAAQTAAFSSSLQTFSAGLPKTGGEAERQPMTETINPRVTLKGRELVDVDIAIQAVKDKVKALEDQRLEQKDKATSVTVQKGDIGDRIARAEAQQADLEPKLEFFLRFYEFMADASAMAGVKAGPVEMAVNTLTKIEQTHTTARKWTRIVQDTEDELRELTGNQGGVKDQNSAGEATAEMDEFGRSKSYSLEQGRSGRAEKRLQRRKRQQQASAAENLLMRHEGDPWEAELAKDYDVSLDGYVTSDESDLESLQKFHADKVDFYSGALAIFEDVAPEFLDLESYLDFFAACKLKYSDEFERMDCKDALVDVLSLLVRWHILWWNPLYIGYPSPSSAHYLAFPPPRHSGDLSFRQSASRSQCRERAGDNANGDEDSQSDYSDSSPTRSQTNGAKQIRRKKLGKEARLHGDGVAPPSDLQQTKDSDQCPKDIDAAPLLGKAVVMDTSLEGFDWYQRVTNFVENVEKHVEEKSKMNDQDNYPEEDMDIVVPLVRKVVYPRFASWISCWNPLSRMQSKALAAGLCEMVLFKDRVDLSDIEDMLQQVKARMEHAAEKLLVAHSITESPIWKKKPATSVAVQLFAFVARQLWRGVKLTKCFLYFSDVIHQTALQHIIFQTILRDRMVPLLDRNRESHRLAIEEFFSCIPSAWFTYGIPEVLSSCLGTLEKVVAADRTKHRLLKEIQRLGKLPTTSA